LERLAAETGAPALSRPEDVWSRPALLAARPQPVWPELLGGAIVLFVLDVAARRLRLARRDVAAAGAVFRGLGRIGSALRLPGPLRPPPRPPARRAVSPGPVQSP